MLELGYYFRAIIGPQYDLVGFDPRGTSTPLTLGTLPHICSCRYWLLDSPAYPVRERTRGVELAQHIPDQFERVGIVIRPRVRTGSNLQRACDGASQARRRVGFDSCGCNGHAEHRPCVWVRQGQLLGRLVSVPWLYLSAKLTYIDRRYGSILGST